MMTLKKRFSNREDLVGASRKNKLGITPMDGLKGMQLKRWFNQPAADHVNKEASKFIYKDFEPFRKMFKKGGRIR